MATALRVAQLSKADGSGGGASRVAEDLTAWLRADGVDVQHWANVWTPDGRARGRDLYGPPPVRQLVRTVHRLSKLCGWPEAVPAEFASLLAAGVHRHDIVHFHDLSSAISPLTVWALSHLVPTVWTMHDCSPFTGGCLYPLECGRFRQGCGECPQLGRWPLDTAFDFTAQLASLKRFVATQGRVVYVTPSRWMSGVAMQSGMFGSAPRVLANGVDTRAFAPQDRQALRQAAAVPADRPVVLLAAGHADDPRKGLRDAVAALRRVAEIPWFVLVVGTFTAATAELLAGLEYLATGSLRGADALRRYYAMADVSLFCSHADNLPLTVLETMACAVPTVGYATGGVPEMVQHDVEGFLAPTGDIEGVAEGLRRGGQQRTFARWGSAARQRVEQDFSARSCADAHRALYAEVLAGRARASA